MKRDASSLGVLGFGAFGRLLVAELSPHVDRVLVHDPATTDLGGRVAAIEDVAGCDVVVLAVPVRAMEDVCVAIAPHVRPGALVADVASVKLLPVEVMERVLPGHCEILGTHPLFGPQTRAEFGTVRGQGCVLCPVRVGDETLMRVRGLLGDEHDGGLGLRLIDRPPDEHDREMALVQVLTHWIGHAGREMGWPELETATVAYTRLMQLTHNVEHDSEALFETIQRFNPHAASARERFVAALHAVGRRIEG
mgnify:CR=1 FL=1